MTTIETTTTTVDLPGDDFVIDDAQLAAVAFLARATRSASPRGRRTSLLPG